MKNMACVSLSARHSMSSRNTTRVTSTLPSPRVSVFAQAFTISADLEPWTGEKNSGSYMPQESLIVKKEKPENPYYFHT